jgi:hypothetical protein
VEQQLLHGGHFMVTSNERTARQEQIGRWRLGLMPWPRSTVCVESSYGRVLLSRISGFLCGRCGVASPARVGKGHTSP